MFWKWKSSVLCYHNDPSLLLSKGRLTLSQLSLSTSLLGLHLDLHHLTPSSRVSRAIYFCIFGAVLRYHVTSCNPSLPLRLCLLAPYRILVPSVQFLANIYSIGMPSLFTLSRLFLSCSKLFIRSKEPSRSFCFHPFRLIYLIFSGSSLHRHACMERKKTGTDKSHEKILARPVQDR